MRIQLAVVNHLRNLVPTGALLLALFTAMPVEATVQKEQFGKRWIVELADAPTLEFRGSDAVLQATSGVTKPRFEATAPTVTGPGRFDVNAPHVQAYAGFLAQRQGEFIDNAEFVLGRELRVDGALKHTANSLILHIDEQEAEQLRALPGVREVYRERLYHLQLADSVGLIGARALNNGSHGLPGVSGEGIVVGIVDSGINWNHRAFSDRAADNAGFSIQNPRSDQLGLCSRSDVPCNNKLIGVYDFTDDWADEIPGLDTEGHGTHVAAIAVGNAWRTGQAGVAPRANLVSYRVCVEQDPNDEDAATCQGAAILDALEQAVRDGVDVVNFSIGAPPTNWSPWSDRVARQLLNLRDAGIMFVTSGGNNGPDPASVSWPAEAPWVLAVAMSTHARRVGRQLSMGSAGDWFMVYGNGGPDLPAAGINGVPMLDGNRAGGTLEGCTAFPANVFQGKIALLRRGGCLFSDKVSNAAAAGARAVVMINNLGGEPIVMGGLQDTTIPAGMISRSAGEEVLALLAAAGGERAVSLPRNTVTIRDETLADQISNQSSRGPSNNAPGLMKPNLAAPGVQIEAAYVSGSEQRAVLSGTSMASPHVAGAAALLRQLHPEWTPNIISSALETTAETAAMTADGLPANLFERGAGRIRADLAARAGLYLPVTRADFDSANPAISGDPGALNLPGMVNEECGNSCSFFRFVTALKPGTWRASGEGEMDITVEPSTPFSLQAGQSKALLITVNPSAAAGSSLQHGSVVLRPEGNTGSLATQRLPIAVRTAVAQLPDLVEISASANQGYQRVDLGFVDTLDQAGFPTSRLITPQVENFSLPQDPNNNTAYDNSEGTRTFLIDVPDGALALWAETTASSATDIDLFVGRDENGDGVAQETEERCKSITPDELERCVIANPEPGQWWVVIQNWRASSAPQDSVRLELAVLTDEDDPGLLAFGPGRHQAGPLELDVYWDQPQLTANTRMLGVIGVSGRRDQRAEGGVVPISLVRQGALEPATTVIFPGETMSVAVPASGTHNRLVFDVPPGTLSLNVQVQGEPGISGTLRRVPFSAIRETAPDTPAPSGAPLVTGSNSGAGFNLPLSGRPTAGRYFVQLQNATANERVVDVSVSLNESETTVPRVGLWDPVGSDDNPRDIAQGIEWQQAGPGFALWYSYDDDGLPVFYLGTNTLNPQSSVWVSDINRFTRGADGAQEPVRAGTVGITAISEEEMVFSWRLNGGHGSDIKRNSNSPACPVADGQPLSYTGTWFTPGQDQGGSSMVITDNAQGHIRYYYDERGVGRWVLATDGGGAPLAEEMDVLEFRGFCPNCDPVAVTAEVIGSYFRSFTSEDSGNERIEFVSRAPLDEVVILEVPISKLSAPLVCP